MRYLMVPFCYILAVGGRLGFFFSELNDAFCCVVLWTNGLVNLWLSD